MSHDRHPHHRLRVLEGPLAGATYVLRDSFVLGRSSVCDLVLLDRRVSRLHARIGRSEDGGHVVFDLASGNGTIVNGQCVRRKTLVPGDEIVIADCCFRYEPIPFLHAASHERLAEPAASEPLRSRTQPVVDAPGDRLVRADAYRGELVDDIVTYRNLAKRLVRGEPLLRRSLERFQQLDQELRDPTDPLGFFQFPISARALIRATSHTDEEGVEVEMLALGVGGAMIRTGRPLVAVDDIAHLTLDVYPPGTRGTIGFVGVAVAVAPTLCRLTFSMGSGWSERMAPTQNAQTMRITAIRVGSLASAQMRE
jgi:hypothetical protein